MCIWNTSYSIMIPYSQPSSISIFSRFPYGTSYRAKHRCEAHITYHPYRCTILNKPRVGAMRAKPEGGGVFERQFLAPLYISIKPPSIKNGIKRPNIPSKMADGGHQHIKETYGHLRRKTAWKVLLRVYKVHPERTINGQRVRVDYLPFI